MPLHPKTLIVITGSTCTGKSSLAVRLCEKLKVKNYAAEIISSDSVSIYEGFHIGTASLSKEEQKGIPHHLLHTEDPRKYFTAGEFVRKAVPIIESLHKNNKIPVITGGSGFYIKALTHGMALPYSENKGEKQNTHLIKDLEAKGLAYLYTKMLEKDPDLKTSIHPNDEYRIIRALEVMESTGERWSTLNKKAKDLKPRYPHSIFFCLYLEREVLKEKVRERSKTMLKKGLLKEVQELLKKNIPLQSKAFQSINYRECLEYLGLQESSIKKPKTMEELEDKITQETMRLAKNQMTWNRRQVPNPYWLNANSLQQILEYLGI